MSNFLETDLKVGDALENSRAPRSWCFCEFNENGGWSQEGRAWAAVGECGLYLMFTKECQWQGVAQRSVHFRVTHSGVYCPVSQLNDVMFHLRLLVMLKSVVCTPGKKAGRESCQSGFCKAFCVLGLRDKSWLMQYLWKELHRLVKASGFTWLSSPVRSVHQLKSDDVAPLGQSPGRCKRGCVWGTDARHPWSFLLEQPSPTASVRNCRGDFLHHTAQDQLLAWTYYKCSVITAMDWKEFSNNKN